MGAEKKEQIKFTRLTKDDVEDHAEQLGMVYYTYPAKIDSPAIKRFKKTFGGD